MLQAFGYSREFWVLDPPQYPSRRMSGSQTKTSSKFFRRSRSRSPSSKRLIDYYKDDIIPVHLPVSPGRTTSFFQRILKSRFVLVVVAVGILTIIILYKSYMERMRQLRMAEYVERVQDLDTSITHLDRHVEAAKAKLQEWKEHYRHTHVKGL